MILTCRKLYVYASHIQDLFYTPNADLIRQVQYASSRDIPFLATGGRHGFTTSLGDLQQGLDLDLSAFRNVSVDVKAKTLTVGGATLFADIYNPLYEAGLEVRTFFSTRPSCG